MESKLNPSRPSASASAETWTQDSAAVRARALDLQRSRTIGVPQPLLRGKNIGFLCESDSDVEMAMLRAAASDLGANIASIRPSLSDLSTPQDIARTARILGRLYDAVVCQGMAPHLVQQLREGTGVPVLEGIPSWADGVDLTLPARDTATPDPRHFLLQAALLSTLR